jgi:hypothetical protein
MARQETRTPVPSDPADEVRAFYGHEFWRFVFVQQ